MTPKSSEQGQNSIGNLIIQISKVRRKKTNALLAVEGIHAGQDILLYYLSVENGQTVSSLVEKIGIRQSTIFTMINRMEAAGMVKKEKDPNDGRTSRIYTTVKGKKTITKIKETWKVMEQTAVKGLSADEEERLLKILKKVLVNYER